MTGLFFLVFQITERKTMKNTVALIAFQEQDNLGIGYIASVLLNSGFDVKLMDFRLGADEILHHVRGSDPSIIGFSIIFQNHIREFKNLLFYLRENGISCHFTAGGHYPSLRCRELMDFIPELDSIVLFEGELTTLELAKRIVDGRDWKGLEGLAFRDRGIVTVNKLRALIPDLDSLSPPVRPPLKEYALGKKFATLLAGRGCVHSCIFCSIREFYSKPSGPVKRIRKPENVVAEIELLYREKNCSIFMFQDDDFPVRNRRWVDRFCALLKEKHLSDKILWKVSCRSDEVDIETFRFMKKHGLFLVYLGIESGTDSGLKMMKKNITPSVNFEAVAILKELEIRYDFGFMLFDPYSTWESIRENLHFLETICSDGSSPVTFCKMLPYAETGIERILEKERRLKGDLGLKDYDFNDDAMNRLYAFIADAFAKWIGSHEGVLNYSRWIRYYLAVYEKYYKVNPAVREIVLSARDTIAESNDFLIKTIYGLVSVFKSNSDYDLAELSRINNSIAFYENLYAEKLSSLILKITELAEKESVPLSRQSR